jgi:hypothetical protein
MPASLALPARSGPFDLVFADPPYGKGLGDRALVSAARGGWLEDGALVVLEEEAAAEPDPGDGFKFLETRTFGDTIMRFFRYDASGLPRNGVWPKEPLKRGSGMTDTMHAEPETASRFSEPTVALPSAAAERAE